MHRSLFSMRARLAANPVVATAFCGVVLCLAVSAPLAMLSGARPDPAALAPTAPSPVRSGALAPEPTALEAEAEPEPAPPPPARPLPRILTEADAELYRRVFALQRARDFAGADRLIARIENRLLMGHVLAQRYQRTARPRYEDLRRWLAQHRDHPDAGRIYRLARKLRPKKARWPRRPRAERTSLIAEIPQPPPYVSNKKLTRKQRRRVRHLKRVMRIWLGRGEISRTERLVRRADVRRLFDRFELDEARASVAEAWFYEGHDRKAYDLVSAALAGSGPKLPLAHWTAGLAAWRLGNVVQAAGHFETLAAASGISGWVGAGAALWAARANTRLQRPDAARRWLEQAARYPYTLYGVLALSELGRALPFASRELTFTAEMADRLAAIGAGRRALALIEASQVERAEQELLGLDRWDRPGIPQALLALADHAALPSISLKIAKRLASDGDDGRRDEPLYAALYPIPPWRVGSRPKIDHALLFAFMRQESDFNAYALSPAGAQGLMQLMPRTARYMRRGLRLRGARRLDAFDPVINVDLGERYLDYLLRHERVKGDLLHLIGAYNSGPGTLGYWARNKIDHGGDPLLFIESIPKLETRLFVRRVLANLWIYRHRLGQHAPSLAAVAAGRFPRYRPIDATDAPQLAGRTPAGDAG